LRSVAEEACKAAAVQRFPDRREGLW